MEMRNDNNQQQKQKKEEEEEEEQVVDVVDGSDIVKLVQNDRVFDTFVEHKFKELDEDEDGKLSVTELIPAVADIGAALGLPSQGTSPDSDHIYSQVLNEFTHGSEEKVSKKEFKQVLSDIMLGMAAGLKRDPIVILRMDGEDLLEFIHSPAYESEMVSVYFSIMSCKEKEEETTTTTTSGLLQLRERIIKALHSLSVDHGMPLSTDPWVMSNIVEPIIDSFLEEEEEDKRDQKKNVCFDQEIFLEAFKRVVERVAQRLNEQPVIVAHTENTFDGSGIKKLLSNKFEFDKAINVALEEAIPKDDRRRHGGGKVSKEYIRAVIDNVGPCASLPPIGAVSEMDVMIKEAVKMVNGDDGKMVKEEEFKKTMAEILASIMLQLEGNPISVSSNSVVHEPHSSSSSSSSSSILLPKLN
ncbi:unnamed protein product [Cochlearia groenlandica]